MRQNPRRIGIARALSKRGHCSRSQGFALVRAGRVAINGICRRDPQFPVDLARDRIAVDGSIISAPNLLYFMLNKPRGLVTTTSDEKGRETIYSCLPLDLPWVAPVGRLDKASEGLLLVTNDSEWAARVLAPETHLDKTYRVQVRGMVEPQIIQSLAKGLRTDAGVLRVRSASILRQGARNTWLEIILDEGKNRHIRRMLEALGIEVLRLVRVAIGPLALGDLPKGKSRQLTSEEKNTLDRAMHSAQNRARRR